MPMHAMNTYFLQGSLVLYLFTFDFGFPIVNFPWLSGDVPRLPSYGIYISQLLDLLGGALALRISILKIFNLLPNY